MKTLKRWADENDYNIFRIDPVGRRARVDKVPSQWFAPQWIPLPEDVTFTEDEVMAYEMEPDDASKET